MFHSAEAGLVNKVPLWYGGGSAWVWLSAALERVQTKYNKIRLLIWTTSMLCMFFSSLDKQRARTSLSDFTFRSLKVPEYQTLFFTMWTSIVLPEEVFVLHLCYDESEPSIPPQLVNPPNPRSFFQWLTMTFTNALNRLIEKERWPRCLRWIVSWILPKERCWNWKWRIEWHGRWTDRVKVDIDHSCASRSMTERASGGSRGRVYPRMPNSIWIQLDEFEERSALPEARFGCSFHLVIEE